eukprot:TRINITY_DN16066_c0_g2_i1.p1 TRINITY_DN16066_c0_g2~~TRINITY_DN16066_c0_g2_i1.p1  ORF type:complete len:578 (+),score=66.66 TRINITY_DN16066_c0_g2_i1:38-1771(+)
MAPEAGTQLPLNTEGECMRCYVRPEASECIICRSCGSPWHLACLTLDKPQSGSTEAEGWACPDCSPTDEPSAAKTFSAQNGTSSAGASREAFANGALPPNGFSLAGTIGRGGLAARAREIQDDLTLTDEQKARRRQDLFTHTGEENEGEEGKAVTISPFSSRAAAKGEAENDGASMLDGKMNCTFCLQLVDRPVTTPCGHNFCLKCFQKWIGQGKRTCAKCRSPIPPRMVSNPRINATLVTAIRMAKAAAAALQGNAPLKHYQSVDNENRPEKAFTTERAVKTGKANACSGRIFVTIPPDHLGPITAEYDPEDGKGVWVGRMWEDRMECRQWGAHFPHVAGIAGQSEFGAQSVALSGGYEDDLDMGEYFIYTGSGGRDLSGNKRTNKEHSFDQKFEGPNEALRVSCRKGYPVRVVRSWKEKRSAYAPAEGEGIRYDGIYRIERCWRKAGAGGHLVCRYLFVRCDNEPAPWLTDEHGDRPRLLPALPEWTTAKDKTERKERPCWDWKDEEQLWGWTREPPSSRKALGKKSSTGGRQQPKSIQKRLLKEFGCTLCRKILCQPVSTPCGHTFCKPCLEAK